MKSREEARGDDYPAHLEHSNTDTQATAPDWKVWVKYLWQYSYVCISTGALYLAACSIRQRICNYNGVTKPLPGLVAVPVSAARVVDVAGVVPGPAARGRALAARVRDQRRRAPPPGLGLPRPRPRPVPVWVCPATLILRQHRSHRADIALKHTTY